MRHLYEAIDFLPMMMQPPIVALIVILVGYFLSKVFAAIVHAAIPKNTTEEESDILPLDARVTRTCFWGSWLMHQDHYRLVFMSEGVMQPEVSIFINNTEIVARFQIFSKA